MQRLFLILLSIILVVRPAHAQEADSSYAYLVSLNYLTEDTHPLTYAAPIDIPLPKYNLDLIKSNQHGSVVIEFLINGQGRVYGEQIVSQASPGLGQSVKDAVSNWTFAVIGQGKKPTSGIVECEFTFSHNAKVKEKFVFGEFWQSIKNACSTTFQLSKSEAALKLFKFLGILILTIVLALISLALAGNDRKMAGALALMFFVICLAALGEIILCLIRIVFIWS